MYDYNLSDLGQRFDVIYIDPPLEEYQRRVSGINFPQKPWGFEEVSSKELSIHIFLERILYTMRVNYQGGLLKLIILFLE